MSPANTLLVQAGEALYGPRWQTDMAIALGVSDRTIRRWVANEPMSWNVMDDVQKLLSDRERICHQIFDTIAAVKKPSGLSIDLAAD